MHRLVGMIVAEGGAIIVTSRRRPDGSIVLCGIVFREPLLGTCKFRLYHQASRRSIPEVPGDCESHNIDIIR
jgi:hypothetical protein